MVEGIQRDLAMLVFWAEKLVIFSVPKTGSSAIDAALAPHADIAISSPPVLKHMPVYRFNRFMGPLFDVVNGKDFERFALIREPIDWLGSWYKYRSRPQLNGQKNSTADVSFDDFVLEARKGKPKPFAEVGSQARFMGGGVGDGGVHHLFQYEQMDKAVAFLQDRLNRDIVLPQKNVSPKRALELSDNARKKYTQKRQEEFELWAKAAK